MFHKDIYNIVISSLAYCFYFVSFNTTLNCLKYLLKSMHDEDKNFNVNAYLGLSLHFAAFTVGPFYASILVNKIGPRSAMTTVSVLQLFYTGQYFVPTNWLFYLTIMIRGAGNGLLLIAQGRYLTQNSTRETMSRNSAIFSWIMSMSRIIGNLYLYFRIDTTTISKEQKSEIFISMFATNIFTCFLFAILLKAKWNVPIKTNVKEAYRTLWKSFIDKNIWLLVPSASFYLIINGFNSGVYANAIGFTERITDVTPFKKITMCGIILGIGNIVGGITLSFSKKLTKGYHYPTIITGYIINCVGFIIAFLNLPRDAHHGSTWDHAIIKSSYTLALISPLFLGIGEIIVFAEMNAITGQLYKEKVAHAFAVITFMFGVSGMLSFVLFNVLTFHIVILLLTFSGFFSTVCYCYLELKPSSRRILDAVEGYTLSEIEVS